jgi:O-antigen/teichoic acid export membrane protein
MHLKKLLAQSLLWRGFYFFSILLINIFLARYLQAALVGWVYYICNIFSVIILLAGLNLDAGITYFASGEKVNSNKLVWLGLMWSIIVALAAWLFLEIFAKYFPPAAGIDTATIVWFALFYIIGTLLINISMALFYSQRNFFLPNIILALANFCFLIFLFLQKKNDQQSLLHVLNAYFLFFLIEGLLLIMVFILKNKSLQQLQLPSLIENKKIYNYALIALLANIVFFLVYRIDYWFVQYYCAGTQMGNYVQVSKLGQILLVVPQIMAGVVFPQTAGGYDMLATRKSVMTISRFLTALYLVLIIVVLFAGKWLFPFVFGSTFNYMFVPFLLILPGIWSLSILALLAAYFSGKGNVKINVIGGLFSVAVMVIGNFIFLPRGGGIIAAAAISTIAYFLYMFYLLKKFIAEYNVRIKDFIFLQKSDLSRIMSLLNFRQ